MATKGAMGREAMGTGPRAQLAAEPAGTGMGMGMGSTSMATTTTTTTMAPQAVPALAPSGMPGPQTVQMGTTGMPTSGGAPQVVV